MGISPERMKNYPGGSIYSREWQLIRNRILARAEHSCEGTEQFPECGAVNGKPHPETGSHVVLTIAHMDQNEANSSDENLRALCQRCHLTWDAPHHAVNARKTRERKSGQFVMDV